MGWGLFPPPLPEDQQNVAFGDIFVNCLSVLDRRMPASRLLTTYIQQKFRKMYVIFFIIIE